MSTKYLLFAFVIAVFFVAIGFSSNGGETGNICNEGCALDAACTGSTPYLCKKGWALDTCVAKGYDGGYCGGKTDKGGYCFECSGGCVAQSELGGEKCGLFTTCGPDEYCCKRAEWYKSNTCKPKHADMGCCGGPPAEGDRTTYLKVNIGNNKPAACTDKAKWEVKAKGASDFVDYSPECVEGSPDVKIENGTSMALTCTSQKLPTAATGPHTARASWCGESVEFKYGLGATSPLQIDVLWVRADPIRDITAPPYETEDPTPTIAIKTSNSALCKISLNNEKYDSMTKACTKKVGLETEFYCISPDVGAPGDKKVFVACKDVVGSDSSKEIDFIRRPDVYSGPIISIDVPFYLYDKPILIKFSFKSVNGLDTGSMEAYVTNKDDDKIADMSPLVFEAYDEFEDKYVYSYDLNLNGYLPGKYGIMAKAKDSMGHSGQLGVPQTFQILKSNDKFNIYAIAVNYGDMDAYRQNAQKELQKFETVSPFREPGCKNQLNMTILDKNCLIEACTQFKTRSSCASGLVTCMETTGISDYDLIMAFGDYKTCGGFTFPGAYPVAVCDSCDPKAGRDLQCAAHELGHMFKLCDEYSKSAWMMQNEDYPTFRLWAESSPYAGCGNPYPGNTGIGPMGFSPPDSCNTDCSIDAKACETGTCGIKLGGTSPPYDTGIMGGGLPGTNSAGYGSEGYQSMLKSLEGMGYCG